MSYVTNDFEESLQRVALEPSQIERVVSAWGHGEGQGDDAGHYKWAEDGASDWSGGFLMLLKDGRYAYLTGWCDYTGWGCQDGANLAFFDHQPTLDEMRASHEYGHEPDASLWDSEPADLNRWLSTGVAVNQ